MVQLRTFIRWSGNKTKHLKKILEYMPSSLIDGTFNGTYFEPFLGSGAMFLRLQPKKWIINDLNKDLINVWNHVGLDPIKIQTMFKDFELIFKPLSLDDKKELCCAITNQIEYLTYELDRAVKYLLMKYCSFTGNIFVKNKFTFIGLNRSIFVDQYYPFFNQLYYDNLQNISTYIHSSNGSIYNTSFEQILEKARKGDFIFLDPPYIESHDYQFNYNKDEKVDKVFLKTLYQYLTKLHLKGVNWLMTQADTDQIKCMFKKYIIKTITVYRPQRKEHVNELLIMNYG